VAEQDTPGATAVLSAVAQWVQHAGVAAPPAGATYCRVPGCAALAFAEIRSKENRLQVCLRHYEAAHAEAAGTAL